MDTTRFEKVTPANFERLKAYLKLNDCEGLDGNEGTAIGQCLDLGYRFDPAAGTLDLSARSLPENLRGLPDDVRVQAGHRLLANVMGLGQPALLAAAAAGNAYPYRPGRYGIYDYVIPYITNETGHIFQFKSQNLTNGTFYTAPEAIPTNATEAQLFEADSTKLSGTGVGGSVDYVWSDNTTVMTISFFLNTKYTHTFSVGFSTTTLTKVVTDTDPVLDGYTYLNPKITVTRV